MNTRFILLVAIVFSLIGCRGSGPTTDDSGESRFAEEQPREAYQNTAAFTNVQLGVSYMREGQLDIALSKLKKAIFQAPQLAIAHSTIAVLYERLGETQLARTHHEKSISFDAKDPRLRNNYGRFLCAQGEEEKAIEQFDMAANNPLYQTPELPMLNAGNCAMRIGDLSQAEKYYRSALKRNPRIALALAGMLEVSMRQENYLQGRAYLQRFSEVSKHTASTLWAGYRIESRMGDKEQAANYAVRLRSRFPDSDETKQLLEEIQQR